jgi:hypothetical protein
MTRVCVDSPSLLEKAVTEAVKRLGGSGTDSSAAADELLLADTELFMQTLVPLIDEVIRHTLEVSTKLGRSHSA